MQNQFVVYNTLPCDDLSSFDRFVQYYPEAAGSAVPTWLLVSFGLFFLGLSGMLISYKNFLVTLMSIECMYLGAVTGFVFYGIGFQDITAVIYGLLILIFAACESAVGLGLLVAIYRFGFSIGFDSIRALGG